MPAGFTASGRFIGTVQVDSLPMLNVVADAEFSRVSRLLCYAASQPIDQDSSVRRILVDLHVLCRDDPSALLTSAAGNVVRGIIGQLEANLAEYRVENEKLRRRVPSRSED